MERQKPSLTIRRRLAAPPATVFAAWTDGQKLAQWWSPHDCEMMDAHLDVFASGSRNPDRTAKFTMSAAPMTSSKPIKNCRLAGTGSPRPNAHRMSH
ncbi:SRPBCC family protein [Thalassospira lucentensis]|uniref:SRPBCC family protein n=1 Tax=Thalassospira lucentensis TaxID=168935 RepID=UPI003AA98175